MKAMISFASTAVLFGLASTGFADFTQPATNLFTRSGYDYAPSVIYQGTTQRFWWCGYAQVPGSQRSSDVIMHRSIDLSTGIWTPITTVLGPREIGWDSAFVCDPTVVQGTFTNPESGAGYSYALYYTATDRPDGTNNRIGVAFSNDGLSWVKYSQPLIAPQVSPTTTYGAGQASAFNANGSANISLFYTDSSTVYGLRMWLRQSANGISFGPPTLLSNSGANLHMNSDFAYDPATGWFYAAIALPGRSGDRETYRFGLYRMPSTDLAAGIGTWEPLAFIDSNLTGQHLNHSPGLLRNQYGSIAGLPNMQVFFGTGSNVPGTWDLTWAYWAPQPRVDFKRYYSSTLGSHWVTVGKVAATYNYEITLGKLFMQPTIGTHPLYSCRVANTNDRFVSWSEGCDGYQVLGVHGWIYSSPSSSETTAPLYRCYVPSAGSHFVSFSSTCEGQNVEYGGQPLGYAAQ